MSGPLVDVGIPSHGRPPFIREAIESVLAQTRPEWRLLVLDDPGGGPTEDAVRPFTRDPRVEYRATGPPMSATEAMSLLMAEGQAPYFAFLHDDDRWGPGFLERRVEFLEGHRDCALVFSGHVDIDGHGGVVARHPLDFRDGVVPRDALFPRFALENVVDTMHSVLVRRSALEEVGARLDPAFPRVFDWELWFRLALRFPVGFVHGEDDVHYRVHGDQISGRAGEAREFLELYDHAAAELAAHAPELRPGDSVRMRHRSGLLLSVALDHLQAGEGRLARSALREAVRANPRGVLHRRFAAAVAGIALGRSGRWALDRGRTAFQRRGRRTKTGPR